MKILYSSLGNLSYLINNRIGHFSILCEEKISGFFIVSTFMNHLQTSNQLETEAKP